MQRSISSWWWYRAISLCPHRASNSCTNITAHNSNTQSHRQKRKKKIINNVFLFSFFFFFSVCVVCRRSPKAFGVLPPLFRQNSNGNMDCVFIVDYKYQGMGWWWWWCRARGGREFVTATGGGGSCDAVRLPMQLPPSLVRQQSPTIALLTPARTNWSQTGWAKQPSTQHTNATVLPSGFRGTKRKKKEKRAIRVISLYQFTL